MRLPQSTKSPADRNDPHRWRSCHIAADEARQMEMQLTGSAMVSANGGRWRAGVAPPLVAALCVSLAGCSADRPLNPSFPLTVDAARTA
jgi:hypothetical protein